MHCTVYNTAQMDDESTHQCSEVIPVHTYYGLLLSGKRSAALLCIYNDAGGCVCRGLLQMLERKSGRFESGLPLGREGKGV